MRLKIKCSISQPFSHTRHLIESSIFTFLRSVAMNFLQLVLQGIELSNNIYNFSFETSKRRDNGATLQTTTNGYKIPRPTRLRHYVNTCNKILQTTIIKHLTLPQEGQPLKHQIQHKYPLTTWSEERALKIPVDWLDHGWP